MSGLFAYPKTKLSRTQSPGRLGNYRAYKPVLRTEFKARCVYCCAPDGLNQAEFGVDHYRPQKLFPSLATEYANLFYACNRCNRRKGSYWPKGLKQHLIPNPCDEVMMKHLRYKGEEVQHQSAAGEFTAKLLDLNAPNMLQIRRAVIHTVELAEEKLQEFTVALAEIRGLVRRGECTAAEVEADEAALIHEIERCKSTLLVFGVLP